MCASHHANSFSVNQNLALQDHIESSLILLMQVAFVLYKLTTQLFFIEEKLFPKQPTIFLKQINV